MAAKKKTSGRPPASKSKKKPAARTAAAKRTTASRKPAGRKPATGKIASGKPAGRKPAGKTPATRRRRVAAAVQATARRGLDAAKEGLVRIKTTTTHLVDEVRDRLTKDEEREPRQDER